MEVPPRGAPLPPRRPEEGPSCLIIVHGSSGLDHRAIRDLNCSSADVCMLTAGYDKGLMITCLTHPPSQAALYGACEHLSAPFFSALCHLALLLRLAASSQFVHPSPHCSLHCLRRRVSHRRTLHPPCGCEPRLTAVSEGRQCG